MPGFCIPVIILTVVFLTFISYLSVKKMLKGTAADALRPYTPKVIKKSLLENFSIWEKLSFGTKWNIRDILRHKSRSAMTLVGVVGCMILLVGGLGMKDTMGSFMALFDEDNELVELSDEGVYLCLRLADTAEIGDTIDFSPYGSDETYQVRVAGYLRSLMTESIIMTDKYAESVGIEYQINSIFTDKEAEDIANSPLILGKQDKTTLMENYDSFMEIMNLMIILLVVAAVILGTVVLYNLGIMSYVERIRELATLKVLGFRDRHIGKLLISQNIWLTVIGVVIGLAAGEGVLYMLITSLASEYELNLTIGILTFVVSILLTFGVSLVVGLMVSRKNKKIDMVEALKGAE